MGTLPAFGTAVPSPRSVHGIDWSDHDRSKIDGCSMWARQGDSFFPIQSSQKKLDPGFYQCVYSRSEGPGLSKMSIQTDTLFDLPDPTAQSIRKEFVDFWDRLPEFSRAGMDCKRGILLYGPPGSGKTSIIHLVASHMIDALGGYVVVVGEPELTYSSLRALRQVEPETPVVVLYEDIDSLVERYGDASYLSMLDGEHQISNVMNIATTNYPERLDTRFVSRPGRFDRVEEFGMPSRDVRGFYLKNKYPELEPDRLEKWLGKTDNWSVAFLRELVVSVKIMGLDEGDTFERLNSMIWTTATSKPMGKAKIGFES